MVTEREKFLVPLRALGPRGTLTLPDRIDLGTACLRQVRASACTVPLPWWQRR